jgi:hypothetical protein
VSETLSDTRKLYITDIEDPSGGRPFSRQRRDQDEPVTHKRNIYCDVNKVKQRVRIFPASKEKSGEGLASPLYVCQPDLTITVYIRKTVGYLLFPLSVFICSTIFKLLNLPFPFNLSILALKPIK